MIRLPPAEIARRALRFSGRHGGLILVLAVALGARFLYIHWFRAFPPGDVFNFINVAKGLPDGTYPPGEKRLPFYPVVLSLFHLFLGWETAAVASAIAASLIALVCIYALGRQVGTSKTALCAGLLLFQAQPHFLIASTRGYADTTVMALFIGGLLSLFRTKTWKGAVLTGALFGAAALTRYEGLAGALVVLPLWFLFPGKLRRFLPALAMATALLVYLPYVVIATQNERPIIGAGYFEEAEKSQYGSDTIPTILKNMHELWWGVGLYGAWGVPMDMVRQIAENPLDTTAIVAEYVTWPHKPTLLLTLVGAVMLLVLHQFRALMFLLLGYAAVSIPPAWYEPYPRYAIFLLPLTVLLFAAGLTTFQRLLERGTHGLSGRFLRFLSATVLLFFVAGFWLPHFAREVQRNQQKHNGKNYSYYLAIHAARRLPGNIGFAKYPDIVGLYFGERAKNLSVIIEKNEDPARAHRKLRDMHITYLVFNESESASYAITNSAYAQPVESFVWKDGVGETNRANIFRLSE